MEKKYIKKNPKTHSIGTSSSLKRPALQIRSKSSPPDAYSITMARWVGVKITYKLICKITKLKIMMYALCLCVCVGVISKFLK